MAYIDRHHLRNLLLGLIAGMAKSLEEAFDFSLKIGMITHYAPLPQMCCLAQTCLIWELSRGKYPFDGWTEQFKDLVNEYFSDVQDEEIRKWIMNVTEKGEYEKARRLLMRPNGTWKSLTHLISVPRVSVIAY